MRFDPAEQWRNRFSQACKTRNTWWWNAVLRLHYTMTIRATLQLLTCRNSYPCPNHTRTPALYTPKLPISTVLMCLPQKIRIRYCDKFCSVLFRGKSINDWHIPSFCVSINKRVTCFVMQWQLWNLKARTDQNCCCHSTGRFCTPSCIHSGVSTNSTMFLRTRLIVGQNFILLLAQGE